MNKHVLIFLSFFIIFLARSLPQGMDTAVVQTLEVEGVQPTVEASAATIEKAFYGSDVSSYISGGRVLLDPQQKLRDTWYIIWAPGMFFITATFLAISPDGPISLYFMILNCLSWSVTSLIFFIILKKYLNPIVSYILLLVPFFTLSIFKNSLLLDTRNLSEPYAISSILIAIGLFYLGLNRKSFKLLAGAGFAMAVSGYLRIHANIFIQFVVVLSLCAAGLFLIINRQEWIRFRPMFKDFFKYLIVPFIVYVFVMAPYIVYNRGKLADNSYMWESAFMFKDTDVNHLVSGGVRTACFVDLEKCEQLKAEILAARIDQSQKPALTQKLKKYTVSTIFTHPISFVDHKLPYLARFWMAPVRLDKIGPSHAENFFYLLPIILIIFFAVVNFKNRFNIALFVLMSSSLIAFIAPSLFMHFEVRYLFQPKVMVYYLCMLAVAQNFGFIKRKFSIKKSALRD